MSSFSVYVTRPDVPKVAFEIFEKKGYKVSAWTEERPVPRDVLLKEISGKDALFCMLTDKIDAEVLNEAGPSLKVIGTMSVGYEHLDLEEIAKRNIKMGYTPGVLTAAVAELTLAVLLATSRRLFESHQTILDGTWPSWSPSWMCGVGLNNSTVGIVGFGRIGQEVARLLQPFGVSQIYYTARSDKPEGEKLKAIRTNLDTLIKTCDFVIVTCVLTPETKGMFNKSIFSKMKPTSIFINTSRGGVVEQDDLIEALKMGQIGAAGLDVMTPEPLPKDHPLLKLKNCVVIPHIGSASIEARHNMAQLTANNIVNALENRPMQTPLILNKTIVLCPQMQCKRSVRHDRECCHMSVLLWDCGCCSSGETSEEDEERGTTIEFMIRLRKKVLKLEEGIWRTKRRRERNRALANPPDTVLVHEPFQP